MADLTSILSNGVMKREGDVVNLGNGYGYSPMNPLEIFLKDLFDKSPDVYRKVIGLFKSDGNTVPVQGTLPVEQTAPPVEETPPPPSAPQPGPGLSIGAAAASESKRQAALRELMKEL